MESWKRWASGQDEGWIDKEIAGCNFRDERLRKRMAKVLEQMSESVGGSIPFACQDWANTKAAYRFFSNGDVTEDEILAGHFEATKTRFSSSAGMGDPVLILHDTTEFIFKRDKSESVGLLHRASTGRRQADGRPAFRTICGILMHSGLAVTKEGLPLGLSAVKFWTRAKFKGCNALKKKINPTRVPIEEKESHRWLENLRLSTKLFGAPDRCVHIADREGDIYELYCAARDEGTHFLIRTCVDRLAGDGNHTIEDEIGLCRVKALHRIAVKDRNGQESSANLEIRYKTVHVLPPIGKRSRYPELKLTVLHATEQGTPKNRDPIKWKLITTLPVHCKADAVEKINWYALRWKIEVFHKILKSGCKAEEAKLRTAERLVNLISLFCVLSWRIFWLTMLNRSCPDANPQLALTEMEIKVLDEVLRTPSSAPCTRTISSYIKRIAQLGGYLARNSDPPPGNTVVWRGLSRLTDIHLGLTLAARIKN